MDNNNKNMRVDKVDKSKKKGKFIVDDEEEADLILESMLKLIKKQEKGVVVGAAAGNSISDATERKKLARYKQTKNTMEFIRPPPPPSRTTPIKGGGKETGTTATATSTNPWIEAPETGTEKKGGEAEGIEVTYNEMYDVVNALNEHIYSYEKDGTYQLPGENEGKYNKLVKLLEQAQNQKAQFERVTPKPRGFGRLRK